MDLLLKDRLAQAFGWHGDLSDPAEEAPSLPVIPTTDAELRLVAGGVPTMPMWDL